MTEPHHTISEFPYDPNADITRLYGLEKLRAMEDRDLAQKALDLYYSGSVQGQRLPPVRHQ